MATTLSWIRRWRGGKALVAGVIALAAVAGGGAQARETVSIGIGTQNTTTNTVTGGIVIKQLQLLEKHLPKTGKYSDIDFKFDWQNFTSGPPITNGMMANKIQIGMMGDYPLLVNGATSQQSKGNETQLVAIIAYNAFGAGNGVVVHKDSPYYELADLKGKLVSVPFGSAAHGMLLQAMQERGWPEDYWNLVSQTPEIGTTNLQERKIDGHADFVPFGELLPFRGNSRKIFDGVQTKVPTFHGVVVRKDFAEQYPEVVVAYIKAMLEANDWVRADPATAARKIEEWTKIEKEVVYIFLGRGGIHTLDPSIKPLQLDTIKTAYGVLQKMKRVKQFDVDAWVNESYVRQAFKERGLNYDAQKQTLANYDVQGQDPVCKKAVTNPAEAGEIWLQGGAIIPLSSATCTLLGVRKYSEAGKKVDVAYVYDKALGIKVFADRAFYATSGPKKDIVPFLLKKDADALAAKSGTAVLSYEQALAAAGR
ncbi:ABC transporter substrate-binding protein [Pseudoduganella namucuonensis]|uniref:Putative aliphatic sulfonates-binding protein n=1 Tax=Pseudoduganella namucuonensis TaxID=1035707 RepID=A0A1I7IP48_9BURK|nr:ABC transporter substrate-binding protein [Pseudoduganella namucuonensis]SFU74684.1 NitT/TauT family transport system substrate-binding protein [Pseudoduganella namucuonensis]